MASSQESEAIARAASADAQRRDAWEPTEAELSYARRNNIDVKDYVWSAQRPQGGVLFPREFKGPGPIVVMEPADICAPVGTDIILVSSYVGPDSEYMKVGERLDWNLTGVGQFVSTNPTRARSILHCPWSSNSRAVEGRSITTQTSGQLYNITRGTETKEDDVAILRGQSWTAITSYEEGTSTVSVFADSIADWNKRRAVSEIHWVDASFLYPKSNVGPLKRKTPDGAMRNGWFDLRTTVVRRSNALALEGWKVRYEVVSGNGVFETGSGQTSRSWTTQTASNGEAIARLTLPGENPVAGTTQVKVSIIRAGTTDAKEAVVNSRTVNYTWTTGDVLGVEVLGPRTVATGQEATYNVVVNNFSDFYYQADLTIETPGGVTYLSSAPNMVETKTSTGRKSYKCTLYNLPPRSYVTVNFIIRKDADVNIDLGVTLSNKAPSEQPTKQRPNPGQRSGVEAPVVTPDANAQPAL